MMELAYNDSNGKGIQVTLIADPCAFIDRARLPCAMPVGRQEYLPRLQRVARVSGTAAAVADSSADCLGNEMIFEHLAPSCYPYGPSEERHPDELPAGDMHCAVLNISEDYAEICETVERIVASPPREWDHGKKAQAKKANGKRADGMSAGG